ncbi:MAG TPA: DUF116 domain-containing protein [Verrucomicrobiota bacterium]|nr:DUF116 domain-containing protein [Verrucomicrobiota bacterium]HNU51019.1 DUF116 domain-containing protein [Verrucomicrobiota bacterium]
MSDKAEKLNRLFEMLSQEARHEGASMPELCRAIVSRKNTENALAFSKAPYARRWVFMPQCLRALGKCRAEERAYEHVCVRCGACPAAAIHAKAEALGYGGVRMLKGGSAVIRLLDEHKPLAVLGVACAFEGAMGMLECERRGVAVQSVLLLRDGCADTTVELADVFETMEFIQP